MARSWHYPRWRRIALQVILVAVFGITLGVAAWVDRYQSARVSIELGPAVRMGELHVRLPRNWAITAQLQYRETHAIRAQESDGTRRISIDRERVNSATSPEEYL